MEPGDDFELIEEDQYDFEMKSSLQVYENIELQEFKTEDGDIYFLPSVTSLQKLESTNVSLVELHDKLE